MHCAPCLQNLHYCRLKCLHAGYHIYIYFLNICAQDPKVYVPKNPHPNISPAPVHHTPIVRFSRFTGFLYSQVLLVQKSSCRHSIFRTLNLLTVACLRKSSVSRTLEYLIVCMRSMPCTTYIQTDTILHLCMWRLRAIANLHPV